MYDEVFFLLDRSSGRENHTKCCNSDLIPLVLKSLRSTKEPNRCTGQHKKPYFLITVLELPEIESKYQRQHYGIFLGILFLHGIILPRYFEIFFIFINYFNNMKHHGSRPEIQWSAVSGVNQQLAAWNTL